jgi:hypothetical protein
MAHNGAAEPPANITIWPPPSKPEVPAPLERSQYGAGRPGFESRERQGIYLFSEPPHLLWGPPSLLFNEAAGAWL